MRGMLIIVCIFFVQGCSDKYIKKMLVVNNAAVERAQGRSIIVRDTASVENWDNRDLVDSRDGKIYRTVKIGNQIWMAQNLAYKPENGKYWRYTKDEDYLSGFGYVYRWKTAVESDICPCGWRIPSIEDYEILLYNFGGPGFEAHVGLISTGISGFNGISSYCRAEVKWFFMPFLWTSEKGIAFSFGRPNRDFYAGFGSWIPMGGLPVRCIKDE